LARWGEPGRGVRPSQVLAGAPVERAVETAKMAAQHKRTDSIIANFKMFILLTRHLLNKSDQWYITVALGSRPLFL
jgi:hypothetical protein